MFIFHSTNDNDVNPIVHSWMQWLIADEIINMIISNKILIERSSYLFAICFSLWSPFHHHLLADSIKNR